MRVLQFSKFYPPVMGGIESVAFELTEGLHRRGIATDVLCADLTHRTRRERAPAGYQITRAGSLGKLLSTSMSPAMLIEARRLVDRYDIVHVQMPDPMAALALWYARPRGRLVVHWQSDVVSQQRALRLYQPLQHWLLRRADAIIATTPPYAASSPWLQPWRHKIHIIPIGISEHGVPPQPARVDALRARFGRRRIVFSLGRMTYYKGFDVLIEAAAQLSGDCVVVVGGGGELLDTYRQEVERRGLGDRLHFIGRVPDDDIAAWFAAADVFCLPSIVRAEAFGVVLLEAMALGRPLVTTDIAGSGVPWVNRHGETGLTVPVGDARALASALEAVLADPTLAQRLGRGARARFEQCFTADVMVDSMLQLYRRLLPEPSAVHSSPAAAGLSS